MAGQAPLPRAGLRTVIGHTRHATLGDPSVNANNHPVLAPGIVLVHNGRIDNHAELVEFSEQERGAEVDSIALAHLLSARAEHPAELLELVQGVAAIAWLDASDPGGLHIARLTGRPLAVGRTRRGDFVASSTAKTLLNTGIRAGVHIKLEGTVPEGTYLRVEGAEVTDMRRFKPQRPKRPIPADLPKATKPCRRPFVDADGVDWSNLVTRRGWSQ